MNPRLADSPRLGAACLALIILTTAARVFAAEPASTAPSSVQIVEYTWHDTARDRDVPVRIYYPQRSAGPVPVILFSHGLGGSREGYSYLGEYWAAHGLVSVHLQHIGSDDAVWRNQSIGTAHAALVQAANAKNAIDRFKDVSFAIDQLEKLNVDGTSPLKGRLDLKKIGMSGHSFGAMTTMAIAGESRTLLGKTMSYADPRVTAAIAMSPQAPHDPATDDSAYADVKIPVFVLTGTLDNSPIGKTTAADRRVSFDHITHAPAYLLTFDGGDHMVFSGARRGHAHNTDTVFHDLILKGTTAFWRAYLMGDKAALAWFKDGAYQNEIGASGKFEEKPTPTSPDAK